jgi:hypothetical protein
MQFWDMDPKMECPTNSTELYDAIFNSFVGDIHPIYKAILEECCKAVFARPPLYTEFPEMARVVMVAFNAATKVLRATMRDKGDTVELHFRGEDFVFPKGAAFLDGSLSDLGGSPSFS